MNELERLEDQQALAEINVGPVRHPATFNNTYTSINFDPDITHLIQIENLDPKLPTKPLASAEPFWSNHFEEIYEVTKLTILENPI